MRIGTFCSGGDAPGMNACLRAVVRSGFAAGHEVIGIQRGYQGLLEADFITRDNALSHGIGPRLVSNIVQAGGTIFRSSRSEEFRTEAGQRKAAAILEKHGIDALIPIGGDGTFHGAVALAKFWPGKMVGCPGTIDNDLMGTDYTIGFHTAVNTAVECVDKLRDTAESHERMFLVEVMGRHSGYIALYTAIAAGAEAVALPEVTTNVEQILDRLKLLRSRGKGSIITVVAEGVVGGAEELQKRLHEAGCPFPTRVMVLGHLQRGGSPIPADRLLASRLGDFAVRSVLAGHSGVMAGEINSQLVLTPFADTFTQHRAVPIELLALLDTLAT